MRLNLEVKLSTVGDAGEITGIIPYGGKRDRDRDILAPGCFDPSLAEYKSLGTMFAMLLGHDPREIPGTWTQAISRPDGLHLQGKLDLESVVGMKAWRLVKSGAIRNLSIGFVTEKSSRLPGGVRRLDRLDLAEISLVAVPAAPGARITGIKHMKGLNMADNLDPSATDTDDTSDLSDRMGALEDGHKALDTRLTSVESALGKTNKGIGRIETMLRRPGAAAISNDPSEQKELERKAFNSYLRSGVERMDQFEAKALNLADDTAGGFAAPPEFVAEILKNIVLYSPVRSVARVTQTGAGTILLPKRTGTPTASWVGETTPRSETQSAYGRNEYVVREMAAFSDISNAMLEDAAFDMGSEISSDLSEQFGKTEGAAFVSGDGVNKPFGFLTDPTIPQVNLNVPRPA